MIYLVLRRVERDWKMSPREWIAAKNQFAIRFINA
jgi:transposase-like protein